MRRSQQRGLCFRGILVAPILSGEGVAWNEEEYDRLLDNRMHLAPRGALGDCALPFTDFW